MMTEKIKKLIRKLKLRASRIIRPFVFISSLVLCSFSFLLGYLSNNTPLAAQERYATQISNAAKNSNIGVVPIASIFTDAKDSSDYYQIFNTAQSFNQNNRQRKAFESYSGFFSNASNTYSYSIKDIGDEENKYSLLISPVNSIYPNSSGNFYHEVWGLRMLFDKNVFVSNEKTENLCFLPESIAKELLNKRGGDDLISLLGSSVTVQYENKITGDKLELKWNICNIFQEDKKAEYFYNIVGNFIPCYINLPAFEKTGFFVSFGRSVFNCFDYISNLQRESSKIGSHTFVELSLEKQLNETLLNNVFNGSTDAQKYAKDFIVYSVITTFIIFLLANFCATAKPVRNKSIILLSILSTLVCLLIINIISAFVFITFLFTIISIIVIWGYCFLMVIRNSIIYVGKRKGDFLNEIYKI